MTLWEVGPHIQIYRRGPEIMGNKSLRKKNNSILFPLSSIRKSFSPSLRQVFELTRLKTRDWQRRQERLLRALHRQITTSSSLSPSTSCTAQHTTPIRKSDLDQYPAWTSDTCLSDTCPAPVPKRLQLWLLWKQQTPSHIANVRPRQELD